MILRDFQVLLVDFEVQEDQKRKWDQNIKDLFKYRNIYQSVGVGQSRRRKWL